MIWNRRVHTDNFIILNEEGGGQKNNFTDKQWYQILQHLKEKCKCFSNLDF